MIVADRPVASFVHDLTGQGVFADTDVTVLENATILRIHAPSHPHIMLRKKLDGWLLEQLPQGDATSVKSAPPAVMLPEAVLFPQKQSGHVISFPDPATGVRLLIAPSIMETGSRSPYRGIGYGVRGSAQGVVVAADSSQIKLDVTVDKGIFLSALGLDALPVGQGAPETAPLEGGQDWFWLGLHSAPAAVLQKDWLVAKADAEKAPLLCGGLRRLLLHALLLPPDTQKMHGILSRLCPSVLNRAAHQRECFFCGLVQRC